MFRSNSIILDSTSMATTSLTLLGHGADLRRFVQCRAPCVAHRRTIGGSAASEGGPLQRRVRRRCSCVNGSRRQMDELLAKNPQRFSRCFINSPRAHTALGLAICRDQRRDVAVFAVTPTFTSLLRAYGTPSCRCCTLLNTLEPPRGSLRFSPFFEGHSHSQVIQTPVVCPSALSPTAPLPPNVVEFRGARSVSAAPRGEVLPFEHQWRGIAPLAAEHALVQRLPLPRRELAYLQGLR